MQYFWATIMVVSMSAAVMYGAHQFFMHRMIKKDNDKGRVGPQLHQGHEIGISANMEIDADVQALTIAVRDAVSDIDRRTAELKEYTKQLEELIDLSDERIKKMSQMLEEAPCIESSDAELSCQRTDAPEVLHMHQRGMKTADIARSLGMGQSEVELRLGVLKRFNR